MDYLHKLVLLLGCMAEVFLIFRQSSAKYKKRITNKLFLIYMCVSLITLGIMFMVFYFGIDFNNPMASKIFPTVFWACMLAGNAMLFYAFQIYTENQKKIHIQQAELAYCKSEIKHLSQAAELNKDFNETLHNTSHYLKLIRELAYENRNAELCDIVDKLCGKLKRENIYGYSNNKILNTILSEYSERACNYGIKFDAYAEPGCVLEQVQDIDLIIMLGNMLDNAVSAASKKGKDSLITVRIFMQKDGKLCIIKVVNDFMGELKEDKGRFLSTKKEPGIHGIGITSISKTAKRYGGYIECYVEDCRFNAILVLPVFGKNGT